MGESGPEESGTGGQAALLRDLDGRLAATDAALAARYPGPPRGRQPVHTVYVPADRFGADAATRWGEAGLAALAAHGQGDDLADVLGIPPDLLAQARPRAEAKLAREPVEDLRVDFEDGYGRRGDAEEDAAATATGTALAAARDDTAGPAFAGLRCKSLEADTRARAVRTLDLFLDAYLAAGGDPAGLIVTCPKVSAPEQVAALVALCAGLEAAHGIAAPALRFELQVETPPAVLGTDGAATVARMLSATDGRCLALVYGTYDYSAALGVAPAEQRSDHPVAEHAKAVMQVAAANTGVRVCDGSSNILPVGDHEAVLHAWRVQARLVWRALRGGLYQGWDMHPAQLPARFLVTYAFFRQGAPAAVARLRAYRGKAESGVMDEPATERALVAYLERGVGCGALDPDEVEVLMDALDTIVRARRVVTPDGIAARWIGVRGGRIVAVEPYDTPVPDGATVVDLAVDEVLLPGLVDTHVHVNEPGRTEWEGFATATRAAAAGGVTTLIDMPLNSIPPTVDAAALETKRACARGTVAVDVGFWGGAVPGNLKELRGLHEAGVFGFKCFLLDSGVDEFPPLAPEELEPVLAEIAALGSLLIVHAEDAEAIDRAPDAAGYRYADFLASRPRGAENLAIAWLLERARWTGARTHVLHLSSSDALPMLASARRDGVAVTVETCPHYLTFTAETVPDGATQYKCCPPIREEANRELLWQGLADGLIDIIVSDHSPSTPELKRFDTGDFGAAWGGISSLQLGLTAIWSQARSRGHTLDDVVRWMASGPAALAGLPRKGRIAVGADADFCVFAPDESAVVDPARLQHRHPVTPYRGRALLGAVRATWLRGVPVDLDAAPRGELLVRE